MSQYRIYSKANLDEAHLNDAIKGVFKTKWLQQNASARRAQLSVAAMLNGSFLLCQNQSQCWLDKIGKAFSGKSDPSRCREVYESCLLLPVAFPSLIDTFLHSWHLEGSFYESLSYKKCFHSMPSLTWTLALQLFFFQSGEASTVKGNKRTHARTHTRTHARTHTLKSCFQLIASNVPFIKCSF